MRIVAEGCSLSLARPVLTRLNKAASGLYPGFTSSGLEEIVVEGPCSVCLIRREGRSELNALGQKTELPSAAGVGSQNPSPLSCIASLRSRVPSTSYTYTFFARKPAAALRVRSDVLLQGHQCACGLPLLLPARSQTKPNQSTGGEAEGTDRMVMTRRVDMFGVVLERHELQRCTRARPFSVETAARCRSSGQLS